MFIWGKSLESTGNTLYILTITENTPVDSASNSNRERDCLENIVNIENLMNLFKNKKSNLPSLYVGKLLTSEKFTTTYYDKIFDMLIA